MEGLIDENVSCERATLGERDWIRAESILLDTILGNEVFINFRCRITQTVIGNHVQIASKVTIGSKEKLTFIGDNSWIGADATILGGVHIGKYCVVGAYTLVGCDIPDYSIVYGREHLIIKPRVFADNGPPDFKNALFYNRRLKAQGKYLTCGEDKNYNSAEIIGNSYQMGQKNILIGNQRTGGSITFGDGVMIGNSNIFEGAGGIKIGSNTQIGNHVHLISNSHDYHFSSLPMTFEPVRIGSNVSIEDFSILLGGSSIPDGAIIRTGSFIRKNN